LPSNANKIDENSRDSIKSNDSASGSGGAGTASPYDAALIGPKSHLSLLDQHNELKKKATAQKESEREKQLKEEEKILASVAETKALLSFSELAKGIQYMEPVKTNWTVPKCILNLPEARHEEIRRLTGITIEGEDVPPPIVSFRVGFYYIRR
jgi:ATP-dependent RNA helicase DDX41